MSDIYFLSHTQLKIKSSDGSTRYDLNADFRHNNQSCTCKGYQNRRSCRHIKEIEDIFTFNSIRNRLHYHLVNVSKVNIYQVLRFKATSKGMWSVTYITRNGGLGCTFINPTKLSESKYYIVASINDDGSLNVSHHGTSKTTKIYLTIDGYKADTKSPTAYTGIYDAVCADEIIKGAPKTPYELWSDLLSQLSVVGIQSGRVDTLMGYNTTLTYKKMTFASINYRAHDNSWSITVGRQSRATSLKYEQIYAYVTKLCGIK
jgi:hypothetical protein